MIISIVSNSLPWNFYVCPLSTMCVLRNTFMSHVHVNGIAWRYRDSRAVGWGSRKRQSREKTGLIFFCFQLYWIVFSHLRYDICLYLNFMLFKITERYKTDKLPSNTHTPPPKLEFFELIRFSRKSKIGKIQKVSGNLLHSWKGSVWWECVSDNLLHSLIAIREEGISFSEGNLKSSKR